MNMPKKLLAVSAILALGLILLPTAITLAEDTPTMSEAQLTNIKANCASAKSTLNQLHVSDALLRVNMGQLYESISTKLMARFTSRAYSNGLNASGLETVLKQYQTSLDSFRADYKSYEEQLAAAISIDCSVQPKEFYDAVLLADIKRKQIHSDVINLNQYLDQYSKALDDFELYFQSNKGTKTE